VELEPYPVRRPVDARPGFGIPVATAAGLLRRSLTL
jgi:hypothetical protein